MEQNRGKIQIINKAALKRLLIVIGILAIIIGCVWFNTIRMPGTTYKGAWLPLTPHEGSLQNALRQDVEKLAGELGERNFYKYKNLTAAANFLEASLANNGYKVSRQGYKIAENTYYNLEVEITGTEKPNEIIVIGGHYDSVIGSYGANDNGTGAAAVLELARVFAGKKTPRTLRFVEFVNEEPPFFQTNDMGSLVYAKTSREQRKAHALRDRHENIVAMLSLETMGYYSDEKGTQNYPSPLSLFYPSTGNFIAFVSNLESGDLLRNAIASFRRHTKFPSEGASLPANINGVGWSDQWSFWQQGYKGIMVTDTAPARYPYYHTSEDTPDKVQYDRLARIVAGLEGVIEDLANSPNSL